MGENYVNGENDVHEVSMTAIGEPLMLIDQDPLIIGL